MTCCALRLYKELTEVDGKCIDFRPDSRYITGKICGARIEEIKDPTMWKIRCLDKVIDELAKGKTLEKIMTRKKQAR